MALLLLALALALYSTSLRHPLVFDDYHLNGYALKTYYADALARFGVRWLSDASFGWVYALLGKDVLWQRLANIALHALAALALFSFLARLFDAVQEDGRNRLFALAGALWFLLNPVAVYGVAYLMERSIVMATLFSLLSLRAFLEGLLRRSRGPFILALLAYFLALGSKEHAIMVPAAAALLVVLNRRLSLQTVREVAGWFLLYAAIGAIVIAQKRSLIGTAYEPLASDIVGPAAAAHLGIEPASAWPLSVLNQAALFFRYLATWILPWPGWMSIDIRTSFPRHLFDGPRLLGLAAWLAWPFASSWLLTRRGYVATAGFGLACAWLLSLTEFVTVRVQEPFVLYRSYLWMWGLAAALPVIIAPLARSWRLPLAAAVAVLLAAGTLERLGTFSSPERLWDDAVRKNGDPSAPYVERAHVARGLAYMSDGRMGEAGADFEQAVSLNPRSPDAYLARATWRLRTGKVEASIEDLDRALSIDPAYAAAYNKRCVAKAGLGRNADAIEDCRKAVKLDPRNEEAWINTGAVYRSLGQREEAARSYERALGIRPGSGSAHYNYGVLLLESGPPDEAMRHHFFVACEARIADACDIIRALRPKNPGAGRPPLPPGTGR